MKRVKLALVSFFCLFMLTTQASGQVSVVVPINSAEHASHHITVSPGAYVQRPHYFASRPHVYSQRQFSYSEPECFRNEYKEEYVPGSRHSPGYVKSYRDRVKIPCSGYSYPYSSAPPHTHHYNPAVDDWFHGDVADHAAETPATDEERCVGGTVLGGILGAVAGHNAFDGDPVGKVLSGAVGATIGNDLSCE